MHQQKFTKQQPYYARWQSKEPFTFYKHDIYITTVARILNFPWNNPGTYIYFRFSLIATFPKFHTNCYISIFGNSSSHGSLISSIFISLISLDMCASDCLPYFNGIFLVLKQTLYIGLHIRRTQNISIYMVYTVLYRSTKRYNQALDKYDFTANWTLHTINKT